MTPFRTDRNPLTPSSTRSRLLRKMRKSAVPRRIKRKGDKPISDRLPVTNDSNSPPLLYFMGLNQDGKPEYHLVQREQLESANPNIFLRLSSVSTLSVGTCRRKNVHIYRFHPYFWAETIDNMMKLMSWDGTNHGPVIRSRRSHPEAEPEYSLFKIYQFGKLLQMNELKDHVIFELEKRRCKKQIATRKVADLGFHIFSLTRQGDFLRAWFFNFMSLSLNRRELHEVTTKWNDNCWVLLVVMIQELRAHLPDADHYLDKFTIVARNELLLSQMITDLRSLPCKQRSNDMYRLRPSFIPVSNQMCRLLGIPLPVLDG